MAYALDWRVHRQRLWRRAGGISIRTKIMGIVLAMVIIPGLIMVLQVRTMAFRSLSEQLRQHGLSVAIAVGSRCDDLAACNDVKLLNQALEDAWQYNRDLRYILLLDPDGHVLAYSAGHGIHQDFILDLSERTQATSDEAYLQQTIRIGQERILETAGPLRNGDVGEIRVGLSEESLRQAVNAMTGGMVLSLAVISLLIIGTGLVLTWKLTSPIAELAEATERVRQGDLQPVVQRTPDDEIGKFVAGFNSLIAQLRQEQAERTSREQIRRFYLKRVIRAQEEERRRVARELHDETGQALASLMVGLRNIDEAPTQEEMRRRLSDLREIIADTLDRVRRLAHDLRPSALDDLGLTTALILYAHQFEERFGIRIEVQEAGLGAYHMSPELETSIYRIVQEALLNAAKHASCTHISVLLQAREDHLLAIVEDNGCGFDCRLIFDEGFRRTKLGLYGMQERAQLVGGDLKIETQPNHGCSIYLSVPLEKHARV